MLEHHPQQRERAQRVVIEILLRNFDRLAGLDQRGEVHDGVESASGEEGVERRLVAGVGLNEFSLRGHGLAPSHDEVVEDGDSVSAAQQMVCNDAADVARSASDEDAHVAPAKK